MTPLLTRALLVGLTCCTAACSMTPDGDPLRPREFTPEAAPTAGVRAREAKRPKLRLGWVRSSKHLGRRITWRDGAAYGHYERRRWTESPAIYLERALCARLFVDKRGPQRSLAKDAVTLDVTLTAFEVLKGDLKADKVPQARVAVSYVLLVGDAHQAEGTLVAEEPIGKLEALRETKDDAPLQAEAVGRCLTRVVDELGTTVVKQLGAGR